MDIVVKPVSQLRLNLQQATCNAATYNMQQATYNKTLPHLEKNLQVARNGAESGRGWARRCLGDS